MAGFWIGFRPPEPEPSHSRGGRNPTRLGGIRLGDFEETFQALTTYWTPSDYQQHWQQAIQRILAGATTSCLITSLPDPAAANFIVWWPLHRHHDRVLVHHQLLFPHHLDVPFDPRDPYRSVGARETHSEEGDPISEWTVPVAALRAYLEALPNQP